MAWRVAPEGRSIACNGSMLKHFRKEREWTQEELAARAGFGVRVVAKAEAGDSVAPATVEVLAATLSEGADRLWPDDLVADPLFLTRRFFRHLGEEQENIAEACRDFLSPELRTVVSGKMDENPIAGEYYGIEGFDEFFRKFFTLFEHVGRTMPVEPEIQVEGNTVVAWGHESIRIRGTSQAKPVPDLATGPGLYVMRLTFKAGLLVRLEDYYDEAGMMVDIQHHKDLAQRLLAGGLPKQDSNHSPQHPIEDGRASSVDDFPATER